MNHEKQCPKCGRIKNQIINGKSLEFVGFFCQDCFLKETKLFSPIPETKFRYCPKCFRSRFLGTFESTTNQKVANWVLAKIKSKYPIKHYSLEYKITKNNLIVTVDFIFMVNSIPVEKSEEFYFPIDSNACPTCNRVSGGYHEALIQIRSEKPAKIESIAKKLIKFIEQDSAIGQIIHLKEGMDIEVVDKRTAISATHSLGVSLSTSRTLVGQKAGKRLFRQTILVRV